MMNKQFTLLALCDSCDTLALQETEMLARFYNVKVQTFKTKCRSNSFFGRAADTLNRMKSELTISRKYMTSVDAIICYGAREIAQGVAKRTNVNLIDRFSLGVFPGVKAMSRADRHSVSERKLVFASFVADEFTRSMVEAIAIARPATAVVWHPIAPAATDSLTIALPNVTIEPQDSLDDAIESGSVDWLLAVSDSKEVGNALQALSAGIPVAIVENHAAASFVDDDCAVIFGAEPPKEEFVRGMLPYIESDIRGKAMSNCAYAKWLEYYDIEKNIPELSTLIESLIHR